MLKLATNLTFMFTEHPFLERFAKARQAGFRYVEFHNPYPFCEDVEAVAAAAQEAGVAIVHFNLPGGDWAAGERGIAVHPDRQADFRAGIAETLPLARRLGCGQLNCPLGYPAAGTDPSVTWQTLVDNLRYAATTLAEAGVRLTLEPLNPITHPGYPLVNTTQALELLDAIDHPNACIQYDYYQMQRSEGELAETVRRNLSRIGYIQLADNPGRHEPGTGEINFPFLLRDLDALGFGGYVSLEYAPTGRTEDSLGWLRDCGLSLG